MTVLRLGWARPAITCLHPHSRATQQFLMWYGVTWEKVLCQPAFRILCTSKLLAFKLGWPCELPASGVLCCLQWDFWTTAVSAGGYFKSRNVLENNWNSSEHHSVIWINNIFNSNQIPGRAHMSWWAALLCITQTIPMTIHS